MKGNDLSNRFSPIIAFRVENFLLEPLPQEEQKESWLQKMFKKEKRNPYDDYKLILKNVQTMNYVFRRTDYTVNLYSLTHPNMLPLLIKKLAPVYYSNLYAVEDYIDLREHLDSQYTVYYFDSSSEALSIVGNMGKPIDDILKIVR